MNPLSTPERQKPHLSAEPKAEAEELERTPGRLGPIKPKDFSVTPDIKPFKGPKGKKVRKTAHEKNEEYTQFIRENESHCFHQYVSLQPASFGDRSLMNTNSKNYRLYVCFDKGPNGSPTYDKSGFELDYDKVAEWMRPKPYNKGAMVRSMDRAVDKSCRDGRSMAEIFFEKGAVPSEAEYSGAKNHWKDRVSKDLNIPFHKIGVEEFEEWEKKGFKKARKGEYENFSKAEEERITRLISSASLRK